MALRRRTARKRRLNVTLTLADVRAWAAAQPAGAAVGETAYPRTCPLARCVSDLYDIPEGAHASVAGSIHVRGYTDSERITEHTVPSSFSVDEFTVGVDSLIDEGYGAPVSREQLLGLLERLERGEENS